MNFDIASKLSRPGSRSPWTVRRSKGVRQQAATALVP